MDDFREVYEREFNTVWHICLAYMKNTAEAEDALQETFLRYMRYCGRKKNPFEGESGVRCRKIRSWLIVTAGNVCKDQLKSWWRKREQLEYYDYESSSREYEPDYVLDAVMRLPDKYKIPVYMYYYMGYDSVEIAGSLHMSKSAVRSILSRARKMLKEEFEKSGDDIGKGGVKYEG